MAGHDFVQGVPVGYQPIWCIVVPLVVEELHCLLDRLQFHTVYPILPGGRFVLYVVDDYPGTVPLELKEAATQSAV